MAQKLVINGRFLLQSVTGVQRVAREVLAVLDRFAQEGRIAAPRVLIPATGEIVAPPMLQSIRLERVGRLSGHAWEQIDLPLACGAEPLLCLGNTAPLTRLRAGNRPIVTMVHDLSYKYFPSAYSWKFRFFYEALMPQVLRHSDHVVTVSRAEMMAIEEHYPFLIGSGRLSFLQNGGISDNIARQMLVKSVPGPEERNYGLYLGSLTKRKNAEGILHAAVAFLKRYPDMRFVVIGATGASFEGMKLDVPLELRKRLEFRGQVDDTTAIYDACCGARFLLFPSFYEASPLPPIEAMTFGCPVISSKIPSLIERCGDAAIYCNPSDQASIAEAINQIMSNETWYARSGSARARAAQFTWEAQAEGLLALCEASA